MKINPLLLTDSYKLGHIKQYPEGTQYVYSNFTPRSNNHFDCPHNFKKDGIIFFGLQAVLTKMVELWDEEFFDVDFHTVYEEFQEATKHYGGFRSEERRVGKECRSGCSRY